MAYSNTTPNYDLPQYVGTDIPNPLTDFNGAMSTIDSTMKEIADGVGASDADIAALKVQNGDSQLTTTAQTLSGAVNELDDDINNASTGLVKKVGDLEAQNGNSVLTTTAQTLSGAVNELKSAVDAIPTATVDTAMSDSSTNAVQNKVIKEYVDDAVGETQNGTLTTGNTTVALTFSDVTLGATTRIKAFSSVFGVNPTAISVAGQVVTLTFDAQASDITVAVTAVN